jgi:hypothetical protein
VPVRELTGTVSASIGAHPAGSSWYAVRFDTAVETQEPGANTPSGLQLVRYTHALIGSRWMGVELTEQEAVSCYVSLVREGQSVPADPSQLKQFPIRLWAECSVLEGAA